jgi:hypothetical protein
MKKLVFFVLFVFMISLASAALGINPAKHVIDFKPGMELEFDFKIASEAGQVIELYSAGEFAELVEFDKKKLIGSGVFSVNIKLPDKIEKPGEHRILIGAREKIEEQSEVVASSIAVQAPIVIKVPYPGKYAEIDFKAGDVNLGEMVSFEIKVFSLGHEPITATASIDVEKDDEKIDSFSLGVKTINNQESDFFKYSVNSSRYGSGDYKAAASVVYETGKAIANTNFRVGRLFINITDYTREIIKGGIKPFQIFVQSMWNNLIEDVSGEVFIKDGDKNITGFLTPSIRLPGWQRKELKGFVDTDELGIGNYDLEIKVNYYDNFTLINGQLDVKRESNFIFYVIGGVVLLVILAVFIWFKFIKNGKKKSKK